MGLRQLIICQVDIHKAMRVQLFAKELSLLIAINSNADKDISGLPPGQAEQLPGQEPESLPPAQDAGELPPAEGEQPQAQPEMGEMQGQETPQAEMETQQQETPEARMTCPSCGSPVDPSWFLCPNCKAPLQ